MMRVDGNFRDEDGLIPEGRCNNSNFVYNGIIMAITVGQSKCVYALEECYRLIQKLSEKENQDSTEEQSEENGNDDL
jgi:hypothetical protein